MLPRDLGPPGEDGEGWPWGGPANVERVLTKPPITNNRKTNPKPPRQWRRNADVWREGFGHGFRDALRLAGRAIDDPDVWSVLSQLADEYDLAGES